MNVLQKAREIEDGLQDDLEKLKALGQSPEAMRQIDEINERLRKMQPSGDLRAYNPTVWYISGDL